MANKIRELVEKARGWQKGGFLPLRASLGFAAGIVAVLLIAAFSYGSLQSRSITSERMASTAEAIDRLRGLLSTLLEAETGQRGYLLTGDAKYLEPFLSAEAAIPGQLDRIKELGASGSEERAQADAVRGLVREKMAELRQTVDMRKNGNLDAALQVVGSNHGQAVMDQLRAQVALIERSEQTELMARQAEWREAANQSVAVSLGGAGILLILIFGTGYAASRNYKAQELESWLRMGQLGFNEQMLGEQSLESIGERALAFIAQHLRAPVAVAYAAHSDGLYHAIAGYAVSDLSAVASVSPGLGVVGQAIKDRSPHHLRAVPVDYLRVATGTGDTEVHEILVCPASIGDAVFGVVELGFLEPVGQPELEFLGRISDSLAIAWRSAMDRLRLENLLITTQQQTEELQTQQEELRVSNEELEEQSRALRTSRAQLENQQEELEQSNVQLSTLAHQLEHQRDELAKSQIDMIGKAAELERVSAYKSEFLANMSHELRTPLNSALILAKLLSDNKDGNLSTEQVRFAQTISSAGNDLLAIINDVLDLAKIESGKVELNPERVKIALLAESTIRVFRPVANEKGLEISAEVAADVPQAMQTDPLRLGQILRNLLANAMKFTPKGTIKLSVSMNAGQILFAVTDTGIGIPEHQQSIIFEAFRQADGSMHRKYGGTGLGLSISRDLAKLLGGTLEVVSTPGLGSTFTLSIPLIAAADNAKPVAAAAPARASAARPAPSASQSVPMPPPASAMEDDRDAPADARRRVLVIEDDPNFAQILRDMAREMQFAAIITHTAAEGLAAAVSLQPIAILLDMQLPDQSGMSVLDELKRDHRTRHIPVHVVSVSDYTHEAMSRGAVGYALKPVQREHLVDALRQMESKATLRLRSVLVVEDNEIQRESIRVLLLSDGVEIVGVDSAGDALSALKQKTFDCMVLDLNLPDMSGYSLLQRMAELEEVSFPPVIVYTGRSLSGEEEQTLRRFSKSIIIKDARSPERLLDEVTLFLHQMESTLPPAQQQMLKSARHREAMLEGRRILVVEDDVRNIFAISSVLEPKGVKIEIARNGLEALAALDRAGRPSADSIDLVLMDLMMPEMDGLTAMREIRKRPEWKKLPIIALTAKAMKDDQENCLAAGANDYIAKPLDVEKFLSLIRVWMPR
jgi:signal transduction histidine kinase/CheY-like chemotaxis protein/CHASE3 domain sensor protein